MMQRTAQKHGRRWLAAGLLTAALGAAAIAVVVAWSRGASRRWDAKLQAIPRVPVQRTDLDVTLRAGGQVESSMRTMIACELESLQYSNQGRTLGAGGRSTILEIVPDGSTVARNQVLCRLDSSDYEELVRQQEIKLEQARNDHMKVELDVKAAEMALREYRDGLLPTQIEALDSQVLLAEVDCSRQADRLAWSRTMLKNGYQSEGQFRAETQKKLGLDVALDRLRGQRNLLRDYQAPAMLRNFEIKVSAAQSQLEYQSVRLRRTEAVMAKFRRQVELCTIRAPHDGFLIYAKPASHSNPVEVGSQVYQKMKLFYLPDLAHMEVQAILNETSVERVREKQSVRVKIEGLPQHVLEGDVVSVEPLPMVRRDLPHGSDVRSYMGRIRLRSSVQGLLPGMTAEVEIQTGHSDGALVIPSESLVIKDGKDYCYVAGPVGLERRELRIGQGTRDLLEVRSGLEEGEEVVLDPSRLDDEEIQQAVVHAADEPDAERNATAHVTH